MMGLHFGKDALGFKKYASLDNSHDGKLTDYEARMKKAEKALADKLTEEEKAQMELAKREEYYKALEKENARNKYISKLGKTIKDEKILADIAELYANGNYAEAIDKQNDYLANYHSELEKTIKADLMKQNPQATPQSGEKASKTKEEIMAIKNPIERQAEIAKNIQLFT